MQVRVRPEARADLELIAAYYGEEDEALRRRFLARVDQVSDRLSMFPSAAPVVFGTLDGLSYRRRVLSDDQRSPIEYVKCLFTGPQRDE